MQKGFFSPKNDKIFDIDNNSNNYNSNKIYSNTNNNDENYISKKDLINREIGILKKFSNNFMEKYKVKTKQRCLQNYHKNFFLNY